MSKTVTYLTTVDNPWNPFTNWDEWIDYDMRKGYNTCQRLARIALVSDVLPESVNDRYLNDAMDKLIEFGAVSKEGQRVEYKKVTKSNQ